MNTASLEAFRQFKPPGPIAAAFLQDRESLVRTLRGPVGSGKTVTMIFDHLSNASLMPECVDDIIRFKLAVIGQTYGQIERNLYPTWKAWLPEDGGGWTPAEFTGGGGRYAEHKIQWDIVRGNRRMQVQFEALFAAIGELAVEQFARGFEPTAWWFFEMDLLPAALLPIAITRLGRYPRRADIKGDKPYRSYIVGDLNAPDIDSEYYRTFEENLPPGFRQFVQPSGLSPKAENLHNLPRGYYERQVALLGKNKNLLKRMVKNEYAPSTDGEPVYGDHYSDDVHYAREPLAVLEGIDLEIGLDAGIQRPAGIIGQLSSKGQFRVLREVVPGRMNARRFCERVLLAVGELAAFAARPLRLARGWGDPAGMSGADREAGELAWLETCAAELGIPIEPTETNELDPRIAAVSDELSYSIEANVPALIIDPSCKIVRKGFASHYRFRKERVGNTERTSDRPEKNDFSHPHDALQYWMLGKKGRHSVIAGARNDRRAQSQPSSVRMKSNVNLFAKRRG